MKRSNKLALFVVLMVTAVFVWVPKPRKARGVSSTISSVTLDQTIPVTRAMPRKRTEFVDWGRNPFAWPQKKGVMDRVFNLKLFCIIWNDKEAHAVINEIIVGVGSKITDKTIKRIEPNRVILTDGTKDYVLEFQE